MRYSFDLEVTANRLDPVGDKDDLVVVKWEDTEGEGVDFEDAEADAYEKVLNHYYDGKLGYDVANIYILNKREVL